MRWGLVGTRGLVDKGGLNAFREAENAELVAALSSDAERATQFGAEHGVGTATADIDEFLAAPGLEAVWIASPTWRHHEQGKAALEAGKHVLLEKPLAIDVKAGWDLVETAKQAGVLLATGYQGRYVPGHRNMKRLLDEGAIGDVSVARTYYGIHRPGPPPEWRQKRETARWGALSDVGTHHIDLLRMLLGEISEASGYFERQQGFETDDAVAAAMQARVGRGRHADDQHQRVDPVHPGRAARHEGGAGRPGHQPAGPGTGDAAPRGRRARGCDWGAAELVGRPARGGDAGGVG